jgi:hypothetical protein
MGDFKCSGYEWTRLIHLVHSSWLRLLVVGSV